MDAPIWPLSESFVRALSAMFPLLYRAAGGWAAAVEPGIGRRAAASASFFATSGFLKRAVRAKVMMLVASVLEARSTFGNQPLRSRALMKSATEVRPLLWPVNRIVVPGLVEVGEPDEVGQRLADLVQHVDGPALLGLQPLDEVDLPLEGGALQLQGVDLPLDLLQLALALLGGGDLGVELADLPRHVEEEAQADQQGAAEEDAEQEVRLHGAGGGRGAAAATAAAAALRFLVGRSEADRLIRIIGRQPFGRPARRRWRPRPPSH